MTSKPTPDKPTTTREEKLLAALDKKSLKKLLQKARKGKL